MRITIPDLCVVALVGPSGCGKSTFARRHFKPTEVLSSDYFRGLVSDDENNQAASADAFDALHYVAEKRLAARRLVVVDATNVVAEDRKGVVELARRHDVLAVAIAFDLPEKLCQERNEGRPDRDFGPHVVRRQREQLRRSLRGLGREGFRYVYILNSPEEVESAAIERQRLWTDRRDESGPFDIIGDVHGCCDELVALLGELGYAVTPADGATADPSTADSATADPGGAVMPPPGRRAIFVGDLVDRGPKIPETLRLVMGMVEAGTALCIPGNHDVKLLRKLRGKEVQVRHGLAESLEQLEREPPEFREKVAAFLDGLISHYVLDGGRLVVAHAGMKEAFQGRASGRVRDFALYGETTGETDEFGLPVRYNWAADYRGGANVVYGHTPVPEPEWLNRTINIDTGCVFGGRLTALRYPEKELVSVPAARTYAEPVRPLQPVAPSSLSAQQQHDDLLDIGDVVGKRIVSTRLQSNVVIREENAIAALEVMSRFAVDPKWLIYLPPTMSPSETSERLGLLEHPAEAFAYYRHQGIARVICQEKHMGSRAVVIAGRDAGAIRRRFGVAGGETGICYTRTGRRFFDDAAVEEELVGHVRVGCDRAGLWDELDSDWICLDCELMPWSAKAQELLRTQYAAVGSASRAALEAALGALGAAKGRSAGVDALLCRYRGRANDSARYVDAYRRYCWPVRSVADLKLAPFHLLATEGAVHADKDHAWHMEVLARLTRPGAGPAGDGPEPGIAPAPCAGGEERSDPPASSDPLAYEATGAERIGSPLAATAYQVVDLTDPESEAEGIRWWEELTARGGEGMVVKPHDFIARGRKGLAQPAVKCRGQEYLRIIYGPEYTEPENLERLRRRGLSVKRSLALREFALGIEALERFVRYEPLRRVHECAFGVLALESEPVDPRL